MRPDPGRTHLRPPAAVPGDVCCGRSLLARTRQPDTDELETRQIIRLQAKRGHLGERRGNGECLEQESTREQIKGLNGEREIKDGERGGGDRLSGKGLGRIRH